MKVLCLLYEQLKEQPSLMVNIEPVMEKYIAADLVSQNHFLRFRACDFYGCYGFIDFKNPLNVKNAVTGIYKCV